MKKTEVSRRQILAGIGIAGWAGGLAGHGTATFFSDREQFINNKVDASSSVAGVADITVDVVEGDSAGEVVFEINLPDGDGNETVNNNPSHVWVRSVDCPDSVSGLSATLVLQCNGSDEILFEEQPLGDILTGLSDGRLLGCSPDTGDNDDCFEPGETRKLTLEFADNPTKAADFKLKFFAQQCRYNSSASPTPPFAGTGPDECEPDRPGPSFCLFPCPVDPCSDLSSPLEFDSSKLPPLFGDKGLSFVALCGDTLTDGDVTLNVTSRNGDGEPTRVYWSVSNGKTVDQVAWKFGSAKGNGSNGGTFKREFPDGATEGSVYSDVDAGTPVSGPPVSCPDGTETKLKYEADEPNDGLDPLDTKAGSDILPRVKQQLNRIDGINLTGEILDRNELSDIRPVPDIDNFANRTFKETGTAVVGSTNGEDVIDAAGKLTVKNNGAVIGSVTNTRGNDVIIKNDGAVAGDVGISADGGRLKGTGNVKVKGGSTVVGDIVTNTDGKNIKVKYGEHGDRSEVIGDARTSGGGSIEVVDYGRVSGTVMTDGGGNITVNTKSRVGGDAITSGGGQITIGNSGASEVCGTADSTGSGNGNVDLNGKQQNDVLDELPDEPAKVFDGVRAGGQANLDAGSVSNGVVADGDVDVDNSEVCGSVVSDGNVDVDNFSVIAEDGDADDIGIDTTEFNIVTGDGELGSEFENFGASTDDQKTSQTIQEGSIIAHKTVSGVQNSFVGGDVIAEVGDIDIPSSVICGDVIAKEGAIDIYSSKTGPPKPVVEGHPNVGSSGREHERRRSLIGGVVRVDGQDCDIAGATVFANGTTEPDGRDDNLAVLVTQQASGGNDLTITDDDAGELQSVLKGDVVVNGDLNVDIDNRSRVEGTVRANAGTVSLNDVTITGPNPNAVDDDAVIIGDGGKIDQLDGNAAVEGSVRVRSGGTLDVGGPATIEGDLIVESGATATTGAVTIEGQRRSP